LAEDAGAAITSPANASMLVGLTGLSRLTWPAPHWQRRSLFVNSGTEIVKPGEAWEASWFRTKEALE